MALAAMQAISTDGSSHAEHHRATYRRDRQREQSVANQESQSEMANLLDQALDLYQLMLLSHHAGPYPSADRIENRSGKRIHQEGARDSSGFIQAKAACQEIRQRRPDQEAGKHSDE